MTSLILLLACTGKILTPADSPADDSSPTQDDSAADDSAADDSDEPAPVAQDYRVAGPYPVNTSDDIEDLGNGCRMDYDRYKPVGDAPDGFVVLSHGFARSNDALSELGAHLASWGLDVVVPDLCHSSFLDADHAQNGQDIALLAAALGFDRVVYGGHSAGGLASLLAASADSHAVAMLGLDPVDSEDLGASAAGSVRVPAYGLFGESSSCNASNNGVAMLNGVAQHRAVRVSEADHCDFEAPTDWVCTVVCQGGNDAFSDDEIAAGIRGLATAFLLWQTGVAPEAEQWWIPGEPYYEELRSSGLVTDL